jgi:hypothetical protein
MSNFDIEIVQGDDRTASITVTNPSTGAAVNLAGKRLTFTAKVHPSGAAAFVKTSPSGGITITNAAGGLASMSILSADTLAYADTTILHCMLRLDDNPANPVTIARGTIRLVAEIL